MGAAFGLAKPSSRDSMPPSSLTGGARGGRASETGAVAAGTLDSITGAAAGAGARATTEGGCEIADGCGASGNGDGAEGDAVSAAVAGMGSAADCAAGLGARDGAAAETDGDSGNRADRMLDGAADVDGNACSIAMRSGGGVLANAAGAGGRASDGAVALVVECFPCPRAIFSDESDSFGLARTLGEVGNA